MGLQRDVSLHSSFNGQKGKPKAESIRGTLSMQNVLDHKIQSFVNIDSMMMSNNQRHFSFADAYCSSRQLSMIESSTTQSNYRCTMSKRTPSCVIIYSEPPLEAVFGSKDSVDSTDTTQNMNQDDLEEMMINEEKHHLFNKQALEELPHRMKQMMGHYAEVTQTKTKTIVNNHLGAFCMILASFLFSLSGLCVKLNSFSVDKLPSFQIVFVRSFLMCIFAFAHAKFNKIDDLLGPKEIRKLLIVRGLIAFIGASASFFAVSILSLGDATALSFMAPIFTGIAGRLVLKEPWELLDAAASAFSLIGVIFVARPGFIFNHILPELSSSSATEANPFHAWAVISSLIGALTGAAAFIVVRSIGKRSNPIINAGYTATIPCIASAIIGPFLDSTSWSLPSLPSTYFLIFLLAMSSYGGQLLLTKSLQLQTAAQASTLNYIQVFFSFSFELLVFGVIPNGWSILGACIIGGSIIGVSLAKMAREKRKDKELPK